MFLLPLFSAAKPQMRTSRWLDPIPQDATIYHTLSFLFLGILFDTSCTNSKSSLQGFVQLFWPVVYVNTPWNSYSISSRSHNITVPWCFWMHHHHCSGCTHLHTWRCHWCAAAKKLQIKMLALLNGQLKEHKNLDAKQALAAFKSEEQTHFTFKLRTIYDIPWIILQPPWKWKSKSKLN